MPTIRVIQLARLRVPQLARLIERTSNDLIPIRIVECNRVHNIPMPLESQQLITSNGIPHLACTIITSSNEFVSTLVERTVRQR